MAADAAVGAVLFQVVGGIGHPTGFLSRNLRQFELNYLTVEKKLSHLSPLSERLIFTSGLSW